MIVMVLPKNPIPIIKAPHMNHHTCSIDIHSSRRVSNLKPKTPKPPNPLNPYRTLNPQNPRSSDIDPSALESGLP